MRVWSSEGLRPRPDCSLAQRACGGGAGLVQHLQMLKSTHIGPVDNACPFKIHSGHTPGALLSACKRSLPACPASGTRTRRQNPFPAAYLSQPGQLAGKRAFLVLGEAVAGHGKLSPPLHRPASPTFETFQGGQPSHDAGNVP